MRLQNSRKQAPRILVRPNFVFPPLFDPSTSNSSFCLLVSSYSHITMISRRVLVASRFLRAHRSPQLRYPFPVIQQIRSYADRVVKVPEMAESISEGTLKQWSKQIGDFVEQDEEIATIETDKVNLSLLLHKSSTSDAVTNRSMSPSMHLRLVLSRNSSRMRRILSLLVRIWCAWNLEVPRKEERQRRQSQSLRSLLRKNSQHLQMQRHRRRRNQNQKTSQVHLLHLRKRRSQSQRRNLHRRNNPSPRPIPSPVALFPLSAAARSAAYARPMFILDSIANMYHRSR